MRSIVNIFGGPERSALDLPVAGLAALAVAFAAFTMPDTVLGRVVDASGISSVLSAAQPPLGNTARLLIAIAGGLFAFAGAFALLRWLDRFAGRWPAPVLYSEPDLETPRVHRADAHPDAPPRRPISAARDLGEPAPPSRPKPAAPKPVVEERVSQRVESPLPVAAPAGLGDLMARLERGLARREGQVAAAPRGSVPAPSPVASNDRLQSAIEGLRALAARG
jgi:hypothetical protein